MDCHSIQMQTAANLDVIAEQMADAAAAHDTEAKQLQRALVGGGTAKALAALLLALFRAPGGVFLKSTLLFDAYDGILVAVLVFGVMEVATGFWVAGDPRRRRGKVKMMICASVVSLVLVTTLGGFTVLKY